MAKTKDRLYDTADTMRPYVDRALHDEDLRSNLKEAFMAARDVYADVLGGRNTLTAAATRVATDKDIQDNLRKTIEELKSAADRMQGKKDHSTRNMIIVLGGLAAALLFNPITGPATRAWIMEKITGESSNDFGYSSSDSGSSTTSGNSGTAA